MVLPWNKKYIKEIERLNCLSNELEKTVCRLKGDKQELLSKIRMNRVADIKEMYGVVNIMGHVIEIACQDVEIIAVNMDCSMTKISGRFIGYR